MPFYPDWSPFWTPICLMDILYGRSIVLFCFGIATWFINVIVGTWLSKPNLVKTSIESIIMENSEKRVPSCPKECSRCVNVDWLEVYCFEDLDRFPCDSDYFEKCGYVVRCRDYGTRVYGQMFTLDDECGIPSIEIRRQPLSDKSKDGGLFPENACHIRLTNVACYRDDAVGFLRSFLARHNYTLQKIFRIDIAMDFEKFDLGDDPQRFVQRYLEGRYSKVNQSNISAHGTDTWRGRTWHSLSWGASKSMVSTKMYLKSLELEQVKDKPYIKWAWYLSGLIENPVSCIKHDKEGRVYHPNIWRVEFSIRSSAKRWYVVEDRNLSKKKDIYVQHTLDCYDSKGRLLLAFANLAQYYFHFKIYEEDKRKDRCKDKVLFNIRVDDDVYRLTGLPSDHRPVDIYKRLYKQLGLYLQSAISPADREIAQQLRDSIGHGMAMTTAPVGVDAKYIAMLQQVLSLRTSQHNKSDVDTSMRTARNLIQDLFDSAW